MAWAAKQGGRIPLWLKLAYSLLVCIIIPVYWVELGPGNFLWFSDIALIAMAFALWWESRLITSTMAVGVLLLELSWLVDLIARGRLTQLAAYMFTQEDRHIDWLSGIFHFTMPAVIIFMLVRLGYDKRGLIGQILVATAVLPATYLLTSPVDNINWVFGPAQPQDTLPPWLYLGLLWLVYVIGVYVPSHFLLTFFCRTNGASSGLNRWLNRK